MRVHFIQNNMVINTVEQDTLDNPFGYFAVADENAGPGWTWDGTKLNPPPTPPKPIPQSVSPRQIRQAMTQVGLRASVEAAIAASDQDTKDWYEFATSFERNHPKVAALAQGLNVTAEQLDQLWVIADGL